jgi:antitoxin component HigA of HigAB toxin-antitoxin module
MAKIVEVDEAEYNQMVALRQVASKMVAKPESRKLLEQAQKLIDPNAPTPLLDQEAAQLAPVKELEKAVNERIAKFEKEREDEKREQTLAQINANQEKAFNRLKSQQHYTDEGIEAIKKLMEAKGLLDVDDAVAIFERANPPQQLSTPSGGLTGDRWNFADTTAPGTDKAIADLIASKGDGQMADAIVQRMANDALMELRGGRR